jgi:hypothetical protein
MELAQGRVQMISLVISGAQSWESTIKVANFVNICPGICELL